MQTIKQLKTLAREQEQAINVWFSGAYTTTPPLFYSSVDIRYAGYKIAPVDTNLFPAGFNLLSEKARERAVATIQDYFCQHYPDAKKVLLITENHTRNQYYLENVRTLHGLLEKAGLEAQHTTLDSETLKKTGGILTHDGFTPDLVLMNNDLSSGAPELLQELKQPVIPPVGMGWYRRSKTAHFDTYSEIARRFANVFGFDPWLISTLFHKCGAINFREKTGLECVAQNVERTLQRIQKKYDEYGIADAPYVFIKADRGTYGMGIMTVRSADEVLEINKKIRHKMDVIKEGVTNSEVIIQEGVPTLDTVDGKVAESLLYLVSGQVVGSTWRVNESRDAFSNLNAPGMTFVSACEGDNESSSAEGKDHCPIHGLIARLATLAAAMECYEPRWEI